MKRDSGHSDLDWCHILGPGWLGSQGWSVLGLRELEACGRQCASTVDLQCLLPSKHRWDTLRVQARPSRSQEHLGDCGSSLSFHGERNSPVSKIDLDGPLGAIAVFIG